MPTLKVSDIFADYTEFNMRQTVFDPADEGMIQLAASIKSQGLLQPVTVTDVPPEYKTRAGGKPYMLICGHRRFFASSELLHHSEIDASYKPGMSLADCYAANLDENLSRKETCLRDEAVAVRRLKEANLSQTEIGQRFGRALLWVQIRLWFWKMIPELQEAASKKEITQTEILEVYKMPEDQQLAFYRHRAGREMTARGAKKIIERQRRASKDMAVLRKQSEIMAMEETLAYAFYEEGENAEAGGTLGLCAPLQWAAGHITTEQLYEKMQEVAKTFGYTFNPVVKDPLG